MARTALRLLTLTFVGSVACSPPTAPLAASPPKPEAPAPAPSATPAVSVSASASVSTTPPPAPDKATLLAVPEGRLRAFAAGRAPGPDHPKGGLLVAATGQGKTWLLELDLATRAVLGRAELLGEATPSFATEDGHTYALLDSGSAHAFVEIAEGPTVKPLATLAADYGVANTFAVLQGRPIVLPDAPEAVPLVFASNGKLVAKRDCKARLFHPKTYELHEHKGRVLLTDLVVADVTGSVCAFDADGTGTVHLLKVPAGQFFALDRMELSGQYSSGKPWVATVDERLKLGPKRDFVFKDPVAEPSSHCEGAAGSAVRKSALVHGTRVVHTFNCCGDTGPAGIWICPK